jgi:hypothetical protein
MPQKLVCALKWKRLGIHGLRALGSVTSNSLKKCQSRNLETYVVEKSDNIKLFAVVLKLLVIQFVRNETKVKTDQMSRITLHVWISVWLLSFLTKFFFFSALHLHNL